MQPTPRYAVVSFAAGQAGIVAQGVTSRAVFQRLFVEPYGMEGERHRPGNGAVVHGALLATDGAAVVAVPVWTWTADDGDSRYLCQASDDGSPPAFSVLARSEQDLLDQVNAQLGPPGG